MSDQRVPRVLYFENLDGLRFLAALAVVLYHTTTYLQFPHGIGGDLSKGLLSLNGGGGHAGVAFFFVLSGFLITYLMFLEDEKTGGFNILLFYVRRLLRIWPLYFLTLLIGFVVYPALANLSDAQHFVEKAQWTLYALFLANFDNIYTGLPSTGILGVHWSVAVEEQFYVVWPLLFVFTRNRRFAPWVFGSLVIGSTMFRWANLGNPDLLYFHTVSALTELGTGGLLALLVFHRADAVDQALARLSTRRTALVYLIGLAFILSKDIWPLVPAVGTRVVAALFFAFVILDQTVSPHSLFKVGSRKALAKLGRISYGLYLLHPIAISLVLYVDARFKTPVALEVIATVVLSLLMSHLSYQYFERPFLGIKARYSPLGLAPPKQVFAGTPGQGVASGAPV